MTNGDGDKDGEGSASKPKRVRTGCLTCRERHLKCDEATPDCNNCKKSNRACKRGVKLNFIDTWTQAPPRLLTLYGTPDWRVEFLDESREIASEYQGGLMKYKHLEPPDLPVSMAFDFVTSAPPAPSLSHQALPPIQGILPDQTYTAPSQQQHDQNNLFDPNLIKQDPPNYQLQLPNSGSSGHTHYGSSGASVSGPASVTSWNTAPSDLSDGSTEKKEFLDNQEETLFMQVFVEEVGLWMDSMDAHKHFSRLLPFHSLSEPMLLNAFLACGARHLVLVNPAAYTEDKALHYYDKATAYLLKNLQNPARDTVICATTAVILNIYEIMSERALQRMNHIAGARALIKECGWSARAQGIGAACFWLNVGLEVLSCLHFNWQVAWDPDDWGIDMDLTREVHNGREEVWTHRMLYIVAKVCNFRATIPRYTEADARDQQLRTQARYEEWCKLKSLAEAWNDGIPRTMQPMAFLYPYQTTSKSMFPEVWLVKRTTIVARLFWHTASLLLAQTNPYAGAAESAEMADLQRRHSQMICGIAAHVKDRYVLALPLNHPVPVHLTDKCVCCDSGVASVAIRSLAHAAECLTDRREQEEVLTIFDKINKETGWRIGFVYIELKQKWGWNEEPLPQEFAQTHTAAKLAKDQQQLAAQGMQQLHSHVQGQQGQGFEFGGSQTFTPAPAAPAPPPPMKKPPAGIPNPMYAKADFSLPQHPYQSHYVAPNLHQHHQFGEAAGGLQMQQQGGQGMYY